MDPLTFFGRSRVTRQTLKLKQPPGENSVYGEVNSDSQKKSVKPCASDKKAKTVVAGKENDAIRDNPVKGATWEVKNTRKKNTAVNVEQRQTTRKPAAKTQKVHVAEVGDSSAKEVVPSGPVYRNVRRSDVIGDPFHEYDFPVDENASPAKKKTKTRKANAAKKADNWYGTVKWEPSKRPILIKPKAVKKKPVKALDPGTISKENECDGVKAPKLSNPIKVVKPQDLGTASKGSDQNGAKVTKIIPSKEHRPIIKPPQPAVLSKPTLLVGGTSPNFTDGNHFTSTPVAGRTTSSTLSGNTALSICARSLLPAGRKNTQANSEPVLPNSKRNVVSCSRGPSMQPNSQCSPCLPMPSICVRESPSFFDAEPIPESPLNSFSALPETLCSKDVGVTSVPVTRSKNTANSEALKSSPAVCFAASASSPVSFSQAISNSPAKSSWFQGNESINNDLSGLFEDMPRTPVLPTRMFSTYGGRIFVPNAENVTKRKMPTLSPSREQGSSRPTTIKFSVPLASSGVEDCFGFDDEDPTFIPQPVTLGGLKTLAHHTQEPGKKKPSLSIQEVQSILKGEAKLSSPANFTPRSIQTKLTDFVCSTPTSTLARVIPQPNAAVMTPTPVPLFGEELLNAELKSPFLQPSRRSYDRFKPSKRIACGDEVHSGDEEDTGDHIVSESVVPEAKKKRSYKKKKKPKDAQLDLWANQLASHFDEVEEVELQLE